ncbi:hypothetical protein BHE74_00017691 [Ensete ventricosum]|nr:hypothetical protein BHE74_00017691 [Ensete ventricosum]
MLLPSDWKASGLDPSFMNFISTTGRVNPPGALLPPFPPSQAYPPMVYLLRQPPRASRSLKPIVLLPPLVLPPILPPIHPTPLCLSPSLLDTGVGELILLEVAAAPLNDDDDDADVVFAVAAVVSGVDLFDWTTIPRSRVKVELIGGGLLSFVRLGIVARLSTRKPALSYPRCGSSDDKVSMMVPFGPKVSGLRVVSHQDISSLARLLYRGIQWAQRSAIRSYVERRLRWLCEPRSARFVIIEALEIMQSCFNVDSTVTARRLVDVKEYYYLFNLGKIKSGDSVGSGSAAPSTATCSAVGSTTKAPTEKGKEPGGKGKELVEVEEVLERGYSIRNLCEVENRTRANGNFASIMMRLSPGEGEELLTPRWLSIPVSARVWIEGSLAVEYLWGALHPVLAKQLYECSSKELMNRVVKSAVWLGASQEVVAVVEHREKELKATVDQMRAELGKGAKCGDRLHSFMRFESGLQKMGRISYEFGYHVALERFQAKHSKAEVEADPFTECPEDGTSDSLSMIVPLLRSSL